MSLRRRHLILDRRRWRLGRTFGQLASILFAALFALQGAVAVSHTHVASPDIAAASHAEASSQRGDRQPDDIQLCDECLAAAAFAHAPPASAPALVQPVLVEARLTVLATAPALQQSVPARRSARAPPTLL
ncbi:MAG: hypothetical protein PVI23_14250 [Maricaulaceae bacterium]|jgi:hypothetical protein